MPATNTPRMKLAACKQLPADPHGDDVHYISSDSESAAGSADESEPECMDADDEDEDVMQVEPEDGRPLYMVKVRVSARSAGPARPGAMQGSHPRRARSGAPRSQNT